MTAVLLLMSLVLLFLLYIGLEKSASGDDTHIHSHTVDEVHDIVRKWDNEIRLWYVCAELGHTVTGVYADAIEHLAGRRWHTVAQWAGRGCAVATLVMLGWILVSWFGA